MIIKFLSNLLLYFLIQNTKADKNVSTRDEGIQMGGSKQKQKQKLIMVKLTKKKKKKKKKDKSSQTKERKATKTLAIVLGKYSHHIIMFV